MINMAAAASSTAELEGYKNFGSFHTTSVEEMLAIPADRWARPTVPIDEDAIVGECVASVIDAYASQCTGSEATAEEVVEELAAIARPVTDSGTGSLPLGRSLLLGKAFMIDPSWCFVNHGAFGGPLVAGLRAAQAWQMYAETQPLRFIDRELFPHVVESIRCMSRAMAADPDATDAATASPASSPCDTILLPNATTGLNIAIAAAPLSPDRPAFTLSICYGALKKMLTHACDRAGATLLLHDTPFPPPKEAAASKEAFDDWIVGLFRDNLPEGAGLAVIDAVTSNTAVVLPVARVAAVCKSKGVPLLVDGAHALGSIGRCGPGAGEGVTWFVSNCHKWWSSPRGLAAMWVDPGMQATTRPLVVSHGYGSGFSSEFIWDGCRDYSAALAIPVVARVRGLLGEGRATRYCRSLLRWAMAHLAAAWGTSGPVPEGCHSHMGLVRVPDGAIHPLGRGGRATSAHAKALQDRLHDECRVECPVKCHSGALFVRISAAVYNCSADYRRLGEAVLALAE